MTSPPDRSSAAASAGSRQQGGAGSIAATRAGTAQDLPGEFSFIRRHFLPLAGPDALALRDDAAVFTPPPGRELTIAADAMVEGIHFLPDDPPDTLGRKLLRANLSDMAAMGARPFGWLLTLACPSASGTDRGHDDAWYAAFARGLAEDQKRFGVSLLGGDTTSTRGPLVMSLTILGDLEPGTGLRRDRARDGDALWVTGTIGDGALGLLALRGDVPDADGFLAGRYRLPQPRVELGLGLSGIAHAAMDVSDGLVQDAGHLARESGVGVTIDIEALPLSAAAKAILDGGAAFSGDAALNLCATGGDDYELLLAVPDDGTDVLLRQAAVTGTPVTRIGRFSSHTSGVSVMRSDGRPFPVTRGGWSHF